MSIGNKVPEIRFEGFCDSWEMIQLGSAAKIKGRLGWKSLKQEEYVSSGPAMIAGKHIKNGVIDWNEVDHIPNWRYLESPEIMLRNNDIIFSKDGSLGNPAVVSNLDVEATINSTMMLVRPYEYLNSKYFYQILNTRYFKDLIKEKVSGSSIPHLFQADMKLFTFPVATPEEQTAIGNTFQKLDNLINQHQQKHEKLSSLKKAMLEKMFPKQGETIPEIRFKGFSGEWEESNLEKCTDLLTGNPFNSKEFTSEGFFLVRGMNVKRGYLDSSPDISEFWPSSKGLERYLLEPEDIVVQMDGALIGKSYAKIKSINLPAILVQRVTRIRCSEVNSEFIYQYIQKDFLKHISGIKTETAVPHLSLHDIRAFSIFLPEIEEQNSIGSYFQKLDALINQHQQQITKLNNIKQACLSKMFV